MRLLVRILKAANLTAKDPNGRSDPYCQVYMGSGENIVHKTEIKLCTLDPEWNETFTVYDGELAPFLHSTDGVEYQLSGYVMVDVWDKDNLNPDDFLGQVMIPLQDVPTTGPKEEWYPLTRRNIKEKVSGSILLETYLRVDKNKIVDKNHMNSDLYQRCKVRGYHLPILSGRDVVDLPGRTENVEMAFSNVFVDISSNHCVAQVFLTNYRLIILSNRHSSKGGRSRASSVDLSTWIALNNIMSIETGQGAIVVRKNQKKQKTTSLTIHCFDIRLIKLIFVLEEETKKLPTIASIPEYIGSARMSDKLTQAASSVKQSASKFGRASPAIGKRLFNFGVDKGKGRGRGGGTQWHADLGIMKTSPLLDPPIPRTRSDAVVAANHAAEALRMTSNVPPFRRRTKSGDSVTMSKHHNTRIDSTEDEDVGVAGGRGDIAAGEGDEDLFEEEGVAGVGVARGRTRHTEGRVDGDALRMNIDTGHRLRVRDSNLRRSRSSEELSTTITALVNGTSNHSTHHHTKAASDHVTTRDDADFCVLTYAEPDDINTGGEYTFILDDCEDDFSDEDLDDPSEEIKELIPFDSTPTFSNRREGTWTKSTPIAPPRASETLINAFQQRLEYIIINFVDYPPALFFVQKYEGYLQLTGWDLYNFPKEMDRQEVSDDKWRLSVQNGPEYKLCATYPQLMYVPKKIEDVAVLQSSHFRSKKRFPCLVWVDSRRKNFMLRCAQPLVGKSGKHSSEDEQLIEACLNAGPPDGEIVIYDARSNMAATGNMLKGKGKENVTHYPRARYTYLDIPNIHAVRESYESLRTLCLSSESSKWYSSLENTQWFANLSLIIKGAVMIARYMKLQRGNALVHCSDGWDRTSQLTSLAQIIMDPYYRTSQGFMVLIEKEWLAFGHKFQHRLGHPDHPSERSPIFLQFLDCVYQMLRMFPKSFEFNSFFLLRIADHLHTGWFGTFLCNSDKERHGISLYARSPSLWAHLMADKDVLTNNDYEQNKQPIFPTSNLRHLKLWEEYFLRHDSSSLTSHSWRRDRDPRDRQSAAAVQRTTSVFSDHLQESWTTDHVIWMDDSKTSECLLCHAKFTPFKRRHHCRACGHIFCDECSKNKIALSHLGYSRPERVCVECYSKLNAAQKTSDTSDGFLLVSCNDSF